MSGWSTRLVEGGDATWSNHDFFKATAMMRHGRLHQNQGIVLRSGRIPQTKNAQTGNGRAKKRDGGFLAAAEQTNNVH